MLFIRCEVRHDIGLKLMMRIDGVQNYKGIMPRMLFLTCDMMDKASPVQTVYF